MKNYTIGALLTADFKQVLLIEKQRPEWQKGKYNLPGGHIEENETGYHCISREFREETGVDIRPAGWNHIGRIHNPDNYFVEFYAAIYDETKHGRIDFNASDEQVMWASVDNLPDNVISNLRWLIPFAINTFQQGNHDNLTYGEFIYKF